MHSDSASSIHVSVCMATYNGAKFVREQLESILRQLGECDEVVIVDDASSDDTVAIISEHDDPRIRLYQNPQNRGYVHSFERAINLARGDVIMLSDQDDLWIDGRVDALVDATAKSGVVASNLLLLGSGEPLRSPLTGRPWLLSSRDDGRRWRNERRILFGDAPYFGCTMAFQREAMSVLMPFPPYLSESHDLWIATAANLAGTLHHLDRPTVSRRLHGDNASASRPRGVRRALGSRLLLIRLFFEAHRRIKGRER